jgi:alkylation response protein AidB-like acyl-CoA dehydrogenase
MTATLDRHNLTNSSVTAEDLRARFAPVFDRLRSGAGLRERERTHPFAEVGELRKLGFGTLRLPPELGGLGASMQQLFAMLTELAAADSNVTQALRQHFARVERLLLDKERPANRRWLERVAAGELFGNGTTEPHGAKLGQMATRVRKEGDGHRLDGKKIYSTGNLYAQWIPVIAVDEDGKSVLAVVSSNAPGVSILDDWDGFGQRLTGTDTTEFKNVYVPAGDVTPLEVFEGHHGAGFHQMVLVAVLAGIGRATRDDLVREIQSRKRIYYTGTGELPRHDAVIQEAVGTAAARVEACDVLAAHAADALAEAWGLWTDGADSGSVNTAFIAAENVIGMAQVVLSREIVDVASRLFDSLGASSTLRANGLDRHWRNARTVASHNSALFKARVVGDYLLNGTVPQIFRAGHDVGEKAND